MEPLNRRLFLVVPDLLNKAISDTSPQTVEVELLLARAQRAYTVGDYEELLFKLFAVDPLSLPVPTAAITYLADTDHRNPSTCLRADPVYLQTDNARVIMFGNDPLNITQAEATALGDLLRPLFADKAMRLETPHPKRWYLHLGEDPDVTFHTLNKVLGQDIHSYLPDSKDWRSLLNETQMMLYECDVNRAREARGELPINSLWFWGRGKLPAAPQPPFVSVSSDEPFAIGLVKLAGMASTLLPSDATQWLALANTPGEHLVVIRDQHPDFAVRFNALWAAPLYKALRSGLLSELSFYTGHGHLFHINRPLLRRWWRRRRPLAGYL